MSWALPFLVTLVAAVLALHMLATVSPPYSTASRYASFLARLIASWFMMVMCAGYGVFASIALRLVGFGGLSQWTTGRAFKWAMWLGTGISTEIVLGDDYLSPWYAGEENGKQVIGERRARVLVMNHQTELDVFLLGCIFPKYCSVTAKKSLKWMPFLGWFMALSKTVFIDRGNRTSALSAFDSAARTMQQEKQSVFIFPEGTRSYADTPTLLPFKKGAFHLAVQAQVPIIPVVAANYRHVLNVKKRIFRSGTIPVAVLKPIETKGMTPADVDGLCQRVRDMMMEELLRLDREIISSKEPPNGTPKGSGQRRATATSADVS